MTTDLEKKFFECFGIEARYEDACTVEDKYWNNEELANEYGTFDQYMNCKCGNQENCTTECSCAYQKEIYPTITDTHYLKLICIYAKRFQQYINYFSNVDEFRQEVLIDFINEVNNFDKNQVQTLFKE